MAGKGERGCERVREMQGDWGRLGEIGEGWGRLGETRHEREGPEESFSARFELLKSRTQLTNRCSARHPARRSAFSRRWASRETGGSATSAS